MIKFMRRMLSIFLLVVAAFVTEYHYAELIKSNEAEKIAIQRIETQISSGKRVLNLSDLVHLRAVPENISQQSRWSQINLNNTNISDISFLSNIKALNNFSIRKTRVDDLSALSHIKEMVSLDVGASLVHDLSPIAELSELERLDIGSNAVASLKPLTENQRLNWLNLHNSYAYDGSKQYYDALKANQRSKIYHGNAYKQDYVPGLAYKSFEFANRLWRSLELDRAYQRWFGPQSS